MILVIQRVSRARVQNLETGEERTLGPGLVVLVGFERGDTAEALPKVVRKVYHLRVFEGEEGKDCFLDEKDVDKIEDGLGELESADVYNLSETGQPTAKAQPPHLSLYRQT